MDSIDHKDEEIDNLQTNNLHPTEKSGLHPRNKHRERYDFKILIKTNPDLAQFVHLNKYNDETIDFANPKAVLNLNKALLQHYYGIDSWDIPEGYLCPPIPGRADYLHHMADLLGQSNAGKIPVGAAIRCLDIGTGANCIYPIIGNKEYGWSFVGSDIDPVAVDNANRILTQNNYQNDQIEIRMQPDENEIFRGIIRDEEFYDFTVCNPPFHASAEEALKSSIRKVSNLNNKKINKPTLNFGGINSELWCEGGEIEFVRNMVLQSKEYSQKCFWFSTLVSKESNLKGIYKALKNVEAKTIRKIEMSHGNKKSRIVAWTFLDEEAQNVWLSNKKNEHKS